MVATPVKTEQLIDIVEANKMLRLLGIGATDPVIICTYGETNKYFPKRKRNRNYDWAEVSLLAKDGREGLFAQAQKALHDTKTNNLGFISSPGGTAKTKRKEVTVGNLLVYEIDDESLEHQWKAWEDANLPKPTMVLFTGGKSYHVYYRLDNHYPIETIELWRKRLSQTIFNWTGFKTDDAMHNAVQPTRLAGGIHPKTGKRSRIVEESGAIYSQREVESFLDDLVEEEKEVGVGAGELWRLDEDETIDVNDYPSAIDLEGVVLPVELAVSKTTMNVINTGLKSGCKGNRYTKAFSLSQTLQAARYQLEDLGYQVKEDDVEQLFTKFCVNSDLYESDIKRCFERHFESYGSGNMTCGELSKVFLKRRIAKYSKEQGYWNKEIKNTKDDSFINLKLPDGNEVEVENTVVSTYEFFLNYVSTVVNEEKNMLRRYVYIRYIKDQLKLKTVKDNELTGLIMEVQDVVMGNTFRPIYAEERINNEIPQIEWVIDGFIPEYDATLVSGEAKTGKTRVIVQICKSILNKEKFLNYSAPTKTRKVILISDDQSYPDTAEMLSRAGIYHHEDLIISAKFRLTTDQLDKVLELIKIYPDAIVIFDSLRSITVSSSVEENNAMMGMLLYDLKNQCIQAKSTLLVIHHANRSKNVGVQSVSGHGSISGACNSIITMHYLQDENNKDIKNVRKRRLVREARSGQPADLVVELDIDTSSVNYVVDFDNYEQEEQQKEELKKLEKVSTNEHIFLSSMLDWSNKNDTASTLIDLMKHAQLCRSGVNKRSDFIKTENNIYTALLKKVNQLVNAKYINEQSDNSGLLGSGRRKLYYLTESGKDFVDGLGGLF